MLHLPNGTALAEACGGTLLYDSGKAISSAVSDSRKVTEGALFVAIVGERTDGHRYVVSAAELGATAVLVETDAIPLTELMAFGCSVVLCESSIKALGRLGVYHKSLCSALTVAVTGSVGKTTTRQFIHAVLSRRYLTHKTEGNYNSDIGLPLTLFELTPEHQASVLELGMSAKGEISYLTNLVHPDIAVITNIGTAHIEFLGAREAIRAAKMELEEGVQPDGPILLNGDEPLLSSVENATYVALYNEAAAYRAVNLRYTPEGMCFDAVCPSFTIPDCRIPTLGDHTVLDAMFAVAVGHLTGLTPDEIRDGLAAFEGVGMRQKIACVDGITYILDYYNASPESIRASLAVTKRLAENQGGRAVAVLGSVLELGEHSESLHRLIGYHAATLPVDLLFTFGTDAAYTAEEAVAYGVPSEAVASFPDTTDATPLTEAVRKALRPNDVVLLKASHSIHLERVADALIKTNN